MEWLVKYEPGKKGEAWGVYRHVDGRKFFEKRFETEEEARYHAEKKERRFANPHGEKPGKVDEASIESFPASDPPAWTRITAQAMPPHKIREDHAHKGSRH